MTLRLQKAADSNHNEHMSTSVTPVEDSDEPNKECLMFPAVLPVIAACIALYRSYYVTQAISPDRFGSEVAILLGLGMLPLGVVTLLCLAAASVRRRFLRVVLLLLSVLCVCAFALDTFIIVEIDNRLTGSNILKYLPEWRIVLHFAKLEHVLVLIVVIFGSAISLPITGVVWRRLFEFCLVLVIAGVGFELSVTAHLQKYSFLGRSFQEPVAQKASVKFRPYLREELDLYRKHSKPREKASIPDEVRNIILLIVESFSASDSFLISGLRNRVKRFDRMSRDGALFTNFYANSYHTEGGMVSILVGTPPIPFPGSSRDFTNSFRYITGIPESFRGKGYYTEFLTTGPLSFTGKGKFMRDIGFDLVRGRDEVPRFKSAQRFSFDSPADGELFDEAEVRIEELLESDSPFFLTLLTVSAHRPTIDPLGRKNNQDNLWDYIDQEIYNFYQNLRDTRFFDDGLLIITGDHRKMFPIEEAERERYGEGAGYRVPFLLIGKGVSVGRIDDRLFQTSDIFSHLDAAVRSSGPLSIAAIVPEQYRKYYTDGSNYGGLSVFDHDGKAYKASVQDQVFLWGDEKPANGDEVELSMHYQRASNQHEHAKRASKWAPVFRQNRVDQESEPYDENSCHSRLKMEVYKGTDINGVLDSNSDRFIEERSIRNVDFRNLFDAGLPLKKKYTIRFNGTITINQSGVYWFRVESDDGAGLAIDNRIIVDANRIKGFSPEDGRIALDVGDYPIELRYFQGSGNAGIQLFWKEPGDKQWLLVPDTAFLSNESCVTSM